MRSCVSRLFPLLLCLLVLASPVRGLEFVITEGANLSSLRQTNPSYYQDFMTGIRQGASDWSSRIASDIRVTVHLEAMDLNPGYVGFCAPTVGTIPYADLRQRLPYLPENPVFATYPSQQIVDPSRVYATSANLKALGYADPALRDSVYDMYITINTTHHYDVDRSDGIHGFDLAGLFAHEAGHGLFCMSCAEGMIPGYTGETHPFVIDFARYAAPGVLDVGPHPGPRYFSLDGGVTDADGGPIDLLFSNGINAGGMQASHWADLRGVMSPILLGNTVIAPEWRDETLAGFAGFRMQSAASPEPATAALAALIGLPVLVRARRRPPRN